jgi:asparaginyl-tRNA synthetase
MKTKIKQIFSEKNLGIPLTVCGWVKSVRDQGQVKFIVINDGSCFESLQVIAGIGFESFDFKEISVGASLIIKGVLQKSLGKGQDIELLAHTISVVGLSTPDYPLQKKGHRMEFMRSIAHLRSRTNTFSAVFKIRSELAFATHNFFHNHGFTYIHTPLITGSDSEGAGEMFNVGTEGKSFFGKKASLTVSGQLHAETLISGLGDVYTFGPTFRAEPSNTKRHAAEFWMIEPEMVFCELDDMINLSEKFIKYIVNHVIINYSTEIDFCGKFIDKSLPDRLNVIINKPFSRISYTDAINLLQKSSKKFDYPVKWGMDLQTEHERYLAEHYFQAPVYVTDYPKDIKAFYMKLNPDGKTVAAVDLLVPSVGELFGGSQREDKYDLLETRMKNIGMSIENYQWYLDLRKYGGAPSSGFGLGFERLVMYVTGIENIRDVIPYPRTVNNLEY